MSLLALWLAIECKYIYASKGISNCMNYLRVFFSYKLKLKMLVFSLVTRWIENVEERENKRISVERYEKNEEDGEKSVQMRRTF
jgi:hypothetical protein